MLVTVLTQMNCTETRKEADGIYRYVAEVGPKLAGFKWRSLSHPVHLLDMNFDSLPHGKTENFYVWENLGCGVSGRALLVSSKNDLKMGVIKCFFSGGSVKIASKEEKDEARKKTRNTEEQRVCP